MVEKVRAANQNAQIQLRLNNAKNLIYTIGPRPNNKSNTDTESAPDINGQINGEMERQ